MGGLKLAARILGLKSLKEVDASERISGLVSALSD